jgi:hypothetical protein
MLQMTKRDINCKRRRDTGGYPISYQNGSPPAMNANASPLARGQFTFNLRYHCCKKRLKCSVMSPLKCSTEYLIRF